MSDRNLESHEQGIDRATTRSVCDGIGERLRQDMRPDSSELPSNLQRLMSELVRQDNRYRR